MALSDKDRTDVTSSQSIGGWEIFLHDGEGFLKTAFGAYEKKKAAFTPEILYNMIAMAIEKFVMSALMRHGKMPYNHTMKDLVEAMDAAFPATFAELREGLLKMDTYQDICDLDGFRIIPPEHSEIPGMLHLAQKLHTLVTP